MKPTRGELWARVQLLAKKKRSVTQGKVPKLGVFDPRSRAQVQVRGQAWSSLVEVSEVAGEHRHSSSTARVKGF